MLRFSGAGVTDVGSVRVHNEDSAYLSPYVALVADGVGGAAAGEVASATAASVLASGVPSRPHRDPVALLVDLLGQAVHRLHEEAATCPDRAGMATTLTALVTDGARVALAHAGDSRAYVLRHGVLLRVSRDHTYVQGLLDQGLITPEGAGQHPWRHVVTRSLPGSAESGPPDVGEVDVVAGDRILVCSDGLTDVVAEARVAEVLELADARSAAARLVGEALAAGAPDNVTCVVLDVLDGPEVAGDGVALGAFEAYVDRAAAARVGLATS
jgi:serine/threonine protein phosphatase PrpC